MDGGSEMVDVLVSTFGSVECRWYFSVAGALAGFDTRLAEDTDACEIRFREMGTFDGVRFPSEIVVRHGDTEFATFRVLHPQGTEVNDARAAPLSFLVVVLLAVSAWACVLAPAAAAAAPTSSAADDGLDASAKVVKIYGSGGVHNLEGYGTGFLVSPSGHVVTVWSHLLDSGDVSVVLNDGRRFSAKFLKGDPGRDLAVLKIEGETLDLPFFDLRETADAAPGTRVLAFSNMFKVATGDEPVSVVHGVIAARARLCARRGAYRSRLRRAGLYRRCGDE